MNADAQKWCFADAKAYAQSIGILHIAPNSAKVADILSDLNRRLDAADRRILRQCDDAYADVIADASFRWGGTYHRGAQQIPVRRRSCNLP